MSAVPLGRYPAGSEAWHEARRTRLGGSEIAAVLGRSVYESRFSLWLRKAGLIGPQPVNPEMEAGHYIEPAAARWFADRHPEFAVVTAGTFVHGERPWQLANPDRLLFDRAGYTAYLDHHRVWGFAADRGGTTLPAPSTPAPVAVLECKFAPYGDGWGTEGTDEIPDPYKLQTRWYSNIFGDIPVHVAALKGGHFGEWLVEQDQHDLTVMLTEGRAFLDSLEAGERPDIDDHEQTYQAVRELHPDIDADEEVELDDAPAIEYLESKDAFTDAERRHRKARAAVVDHIGNANFATWKGVRIARRQSTNGNTPHLTSTRKDPRDLVRTDEGEAA